MADLQEIASPKKIIDEFFIQDGSIYKNLRTRSSLIAALDDLEFCRAYPRRLKSLNLSHTQIKEFSKILPNFAAISIYCTSIDLLGRVLKKRQPKYTEIADFFKESAEMYFGQNKSSSAILYNLRKSVSHHYMLLDNSAATMGGKQVAELTSEGQWVFYLNPMVTSLDIARYKMHNKILNSSLIEQREVADYIFHNCFFYNPVS